MSNQGSGKKVKGIVDIVFLMDATASMSSCIEAVKNNINSFIDSICDSTKQDNPVGDWRAKVVGYRDFLDDADAKALEDNPFVHNDANALKAQLAALEAVGGGDEPESLLVAIIHLAYMDATENGTQALDPNKWRYRGDAARVIIIFTDAPCHMETKEGGTIEDVVNNCHSQRLCLNIFAPEYPCYEELEQIDKTEYEAFEINEGETGVEALARFTNDQAKFQKAMKLLAKTVSQTADKGGTPIL